MKLFWVWYAIIHSLYPIQSSYLKSDMVYVIYVNKNNFNNWLILWRYLWS